MFIAIPIFSFLGIKFRDINKSFANGWAQCVTACYKLDNCWQLANSLLTACWLIPFRLWVFQKSAAHKNGFEVLVLNENDGMASFTIPHNTFSLAGVRRPAQWQCFAMDSGPTTCNILNYEIMSRYLALISRVSICCSFHAVSIANHLSNFPVSICRVYANTVPG